MRRYYLVCPLIIPGLAHHINNLLPGAAAELCIDFKVDYTVYKEIPC